MKTTYQRQPSCQIYSWLKMQMTKEKRRVAWTWYRRQLHKLWWLTKTPESPSLKKRPNHRKILWWRKSRMLCSNRKDQQLAQKRRAQKKWPLLRYILKMWLIQSLKHRKERPRRHWSSRDPTDLATLRSRPLPLPRSSLKVKLKIMRIKKLKEKVHLPNNIWRSKRLK